MRLIESLFLCKALSNIVGVARQLVLCLQQVSRHLSSIVAVILLLQAPSHCCC